jgi:O-antigen/teichoic acid export membrane protein
MKLLDHLKGYMPVSLANGLVGFGSVFVFTRLLGGDDYGRYALLFSCMALLHTFTLTWVEAAGFRFAGKALEEGDLPGHYRTGLSLIVKSLILTALGVGVLAILFRDDPSYLNILPWLFVVNAVVTFGQFALEAHRAHQRVGRYALAQTSRILIGFLAGAALAYFADFGAAAPFMGLLVGGLVLLSREGPWLLKQAQGGKLQPARSRAWLAFGIPVAAAMVLDILLASSDRFLIKFFLDEMAVGAYAAGYGVADRPVLMICAWAALGASPLLMEAYEKEGGTAAGKAAGELFRMILFLGLPAAVGLALVANPLAEAAISEDLRQEAAEIIPFIAFSGLLNGLLIHYVSESFQLVRRTDQRAVLMIVPVLANLALNIVLIPRLGVMGAVYATVISYGLAVLLLGVFGRRLLYLPVPLGEIFKVVIAALAMWPVLSVMPNLGSWAELLLKSFAGGTIYMLVAVLLNAGGSRDLLRTRLNWEEKHHARRD